MLEIIIDLLKMMSDLFIKYFNFKHFDLILYILPSKGIDVYEKILSEECVEEIYLYIKIAIETNENSNGFKVELNFNFNETRTINEIWRKLDELGIDITRKEIQDIIKYIERKNK